MSKKPLNYFFLTSKEEDSMKVLWASDRALSATEIAAGIPNRAWPASSIQSILRNLEKKKAIKVAEISKLGKSYGRLFVPTLTANEYATMQFQRYYQKDTSDDLSLVSSLLGNRSGKKEIVAILQQLLEKYREE